MIAAIMQPYFFPYIGYFQLAACADVFVIYDDIQYMKGGWINRNRLARDGKDFWITMPVVADHFELNINQRRYRLSGEDTAKFFRQVEGAYVRAPRFREIMKLIREIMAFGDSNVAAFNAHLIRRIAAHLGLKTRFVMSSSLDDDKRLGGQDRVIDICAKLGATHYVNATGGKALYQDEAFRREGLRLSFLQPALLEGADENPAFLSIIDTLMTHDHDAVREMLSAFKLVTHGA